MRNLKNSYDLNDQKEENVKKSQKHDVNLQKNSTIYFQVGLIVCLLFSYGLLEMKFESKKFVPNVAYNVEDPVDYVPDNFKIYEEPVTKVKETPKSKTKVLEEIKVVENDDPIAKETEAIITEPETTTELPKEPNFKDLVDEPKDPVTIPYAFVEVVPVFPGCETAVTNAERKACMSSKITKHIQKKFDTNIAGDLGLEGVQRINVMFKIDQNGNVTDIQARSAYKQLEKEAKEVIGKLPQMTPGKQHDKNVSVIYGIPITFNVQN